MKKIFTLMLTASFVVGVFAQRPEGVIKKASVPPEIDGEVDPVWDDANVYNIDKAFQAEVPSVDGTTWKALWDEDGIYVLVECLDDEWLPLYLDDPVGENTWEYDKAEIYFDVNYELVDGGGAGDKQGSGHYQVAPAPILDMNDGTPLTQGFWEEDGDIVTYSINVEDPNHRYEYFIPMDALVQDNGSGVDLVAEIGFDVTMIDRDTGDEGRKRAVWANTGVGGAAVESWSNMDDCGRITLEGAVAGVYIDSIALEDAAIDENNGVVMIMATVYPENASNKILKWSVENGTGRATISAGGYVTGVLDGTVTVTGAANDGSYMDATCTVTISNQIVSIGEINVIKNGVFDNVNDDGTAELWGGWVDIADVSTQVVEGVAEMYPDPSVAGDPQQWRYQFSQNDLQGMPDIEYQFGFVAWADDDVADFPVDFEDIAGNDHNRYGSTNSEWSSDGRSEWHIPITTIPTMYTMDVTFDEIADNTDQKVQFMPGLIDVGTVYLDSVYLINLDDLALITDYVPVETIVISGDGSVAVDATIQMTAVVTPSTALLTGVRWSVVNGTGEASIDADGMLTGVAGGIVTVVATAKDDSGVTDVMEVSVGAAIGISQKSVETLKLYPNPAVNELNVVLNSENTTVSIYNSVGQKMDQVVVSGSQHKFDISSYAAGIYFVKTGASIAKFVK